MQSIDWKTGLGVEIVAPKRPSLKAEINKLEKSVHKDIIKAMAMPPNWLGDRRFFKTQGGEPVGTTHTWKDGKKYQKQQDGTWKEVSSGKQDTKKEEGDGEGRKKEGGPGMSADQLREALKQYHIKKDEFNGGFLLKIGPKNGVDGENYIGEDGKPGEYNDSKTFESKEEVKQFIKDKIIPNLGKESTNANKKEHLDAQRNIADGFLSSTQRVFNIDLQNDISRLHHAEDLTQIKSIIQESANKVPPARRSTYESRINELFDAKDFNSPKLSNKEPKESDTSKKKDDGGKDGSGEGSAPDFDDDGKLIPPHKFVEDTLGALTDMAFNIEKTAAEKLSPQDEPFVIYNDVRGGTGVERIAGEMKRYFVSILSGSESEQESKANLKQLLSQNPWTEGFANLISESDERAYAEMKDKIIQLKQDITAGASNKKERRKLIMPFKEALRISMPVELPVGTQIKRGNEIYTKTKWYDNGTAWLDQEQASRHAKDKRFKTNRDEKSDNS